MSITIYIEGGGNSKELRTRCRKGFSKLFEKCGLIGKMPKLVACGSREDAFGNFKTNFLKASQKDVIYLLVDSEDPVNNIEEPWKHLRKRDGWDKPGDATDQNVFLMTTSMETWIVCDQDALKEHYGSDFQESALPALSDMESRERHRIFDCLKNATRNCKGTYQKGKQSFVILAKIDPQSIKQYLPSFARMLEIIK